MHPEIIRAVASQQIKQWVAAANADDRARQARRAAGASRAHKQSRRLGRRLVATGRQATRGA